MVRFYLYQKKKKELESTLSRLRNVYKNALFMPPIIKKKVKISLLKWLHIISKNQNTGFVNLDRTCFKKTKLMIMYNVYHFQT